MTIELKPGAQIKNYILQEMLGRGAAGEVWRAVATGREVAIKFVNLGDDKFRKSLEAEVKALRKLQHPHIPALYDYDLRGERPYIVMQHIEGMTYDHLIASGELLRVPVAKRLDALQAIAEAVTAAHKSGIIHRDIKPANVSGIEKPYLLDFGIALESWRSSRAQPQVGTAIYMPPDGQADILSDNYSFALLAYEVLFGRHPIFTPENIGKTVLETRQMAGIRLRLGDWRWPSRIPAPELPGDLYGANLARLDIVFVEALGPRETRYTDLLRFVADLRDAILTPENEAFANFPAPPSVMAAPIPTEAAFTANEVAIARQATDHGRPAQPQQRNWLLVGCPIALLFWFILIALLLIFYRG